MTLESPRGQTYLDPFEGQLKSVSEKPSYYAHKLDLLTFIVPLGVLNENRALFMSVLGEKVKPKK